MDWVETLNRALDYIEDHLLQEVTCGQIASSVHLSAAHLQRCFVALTGMTLGEYVRNRRLTLAGHELSAQGAKVLDVALKYGYETPESFAKAFRRFHDVPPSRARRSGVPLKSFQRLTVKIVMEGGSVMDYRIEQKPAFAVVVRTKVFGDDATTEVPAFWDEYRAQGLDQRVSPNVGVCGGADPVSKTFRYGIGRQVRPGAKPPEGFEEWTIPAHTWAVFTCRGAMPDAIQSMWKRIYGEWLPQAKYELISASYDFEYYTEGDMDAPDYVSEIWAPVREKA